MSVLCPFSAGFIFRRSTALRGLLVGPDGERGKPSWGDPIAHHRYFGSLYRHSDHPFFSDPLEAWDELVVDQRHLFDASAVPPPQPTWDFSDASSEVVPPLGQTETGRGHTGHQRADVLAWYAPAHACAENEYGIRWRIPGDWNTIESSRTSTAATTLASAATIPKPNRPFRYRKCSMPLNGGCARSPTGIRHSWPNAFLLLRTACCG